MTGYHNHAGKSADAEWLQQRQSASSARADIGKFDGGWLSDPRRSKKGHVISGGFNIYPERHRILMSKIRNVLEAPCRRHAIEALERGTSGLRSAPKPGRNLDAPPLLPL